MCLQNNYITYLFLELTSWIQVPDTSDLQFAFFIPILRNKLNNEPFSRLHLKWKWQNMLHKNTLPPSFKPRWVFQINCLRSLYIQLHSIFSYKCLLTREYTCNMAYLIKFDRLSSPLKFRQIWTLLLVQSAAWSEIEP